MCVCAHVRLRSAVYVYCEVKSLKLCFLSLFFFILHLSLF